MFEKVLGRGLRLSQCRLDGHRSCDFEAKPIVAPQRRRRPGRLIARTSDRFRDAPTPTTAPSRAWRRMSKVLKIENLHVAIDGKEILKGVDLTIRQGEVHALMGPNGSGKSTLSYALMGHPNYEVTEGTATLDGVDLLELEADERAKAGLFLAFQYPTSIPGVTVANFLRHAVTNVRNPDRKEGEDLIAGALQFRRPHHGRTFRSSSQSTISTGRTLRPWRCWRISSAGRNSSGCSSCVRTGRRRWRCRHIPLSQSVTN